MFLVNTFFLLLVLGIQIKLKGIYARPSSDFRRSCPSTGIPQGSQRGVNVRHDKKPVFKIDVGGIQKHGYESGQQYEINVLAQDPNTQFGDVLLWLQTESDRCKVGKLDATKGLYLQPENCLHMVFKDTKPAAYKFTFKWTAPACGCILVRARVESADKSVYFMEDEDVVTGYLTKRICPQEGSVTLKQMSKQEKYKLLCEVTDGASADDVARRTYVQTRRKVDFSKMPWIEQEAWILAFDQRIFEVQQCCKMIPSEQENCLSDVRRHRLDKFCAYGESIVPFTDKRRDFMIKRQDECCWRLGEGRYQCFSSGPMVDGTGRHVDAIENMDESEPINDLEDFQTEIGYKIVQSKNDMNDDLQNNPMILTMNEPKNDDSIQSVGKIADNIEIPHDESFGKNKTDNYNELEDDESDENENVDGSENLSKEEKQTNNKHKTDLDETAVKLVTSPSIQKKDDITTLASTFSTETSEVLKRKFQRTKTKLECCDLGKKYGIGYIHGDFWDRCENEAHVTAKQYKAGKRRCKNFFMRCCIEHSKRILTKIRSSTRPIVPIILNHLAILRYFLKVIIPSIGNSKYTYGRKANEVAQLIENLIKKLGNSDSKLEMKLHSPTNGIVYSKEIKRNKLPTTKIKNGISVIDFTSKINNMASE
ncbi:uncharacterized protein LOC134687195 isoform X1 [Mytilus trossulus]|uniref:uncharacterized protein LOC134687195 isoform X1 n=1 Tax=Mytilus trossulus TaxID=6551 RepID=UPI00300784BC